MRLLLDECVPVQLRLRLHGHEAVTVAFLGWKGVRNSCLIALAQEHGFDLLLTADRSFVLPTAPDHRRIGVIVLPDNRRRPLLAMADSILRVIEAAPRGAVTIVPAPDEEHDERR